MREGEQILYADVSILGGDGYRLPTEVEWQYACRAGSDSKFGYSDRQEDLDKYGWYQKNSDNQGHKVGGKLPNGFGLYDMHGNANEWCWERVLRGGGWINDVDGCAAGFRLFREPANRDHDRGFRVARGPSHQEAEARKNAADIVAQYGGIAGLKLARPEDGQDQPSVPPPAEAKILFDGKSLDRWSSHNSNNPAPLEASCQWRHPGTKRQHPDARSSRSPINSMSSFASPTFRTLSGKIAATAAFFSRDVTRFKFSTATGNRAEGWLRRDLWPRRSDRERLQGANGLADI